MSHILDQMITLDTDHYCNTHPDLQAAVKGMSPIDQKIWLLLHYVKHGHTEGRKHKLKNQPKASGASGDAHAAPAPEVIAKTNKKREHKTNKDVNDVHELIKKFQHQHHSKGDGVRDKKNDAHAPMKNKNVFWEITN